MVSSDTTKSLYVKKSKNNIVADFSPLIFFFTSQKMSLLRLNNLSDTFTRQRPTKIFSDYYFFLCLFLRNLFLRLCVAILWPFLFLPLGILL